MGSILFKNDVMSLEDCQMNLRGFSRQMQWIIEAFNVNEYQS